MDISSSVAPPRGFLAMPLPCAEGNCCAGLESSTMQPCRVLCRGAPHTLGVTLSREWPTLPRADGGETGARKGLASSF